MEERSSTRTVMRWLSSVSPSSMTQLWHVCIIAHHLLLHYNMAMYQYSLLYSLAYSHSFIRQLWYHITTATQLSLFCPTPLITLLARRLLYNRDTWRTFSYQQGGEVGHHPQRASLWHHLQPEGQHNATTNLVIFCILCTYWSKVSSKQWCKKGALLIMSLSPWYFSIEGVPPYFILLDTPVLRVLHHTSFSLILQF